MKATHAGQLNKRRKKALLRLEEQKVLGIKPYKLNPSDEVDSIPTSIPLNEIDKKRIDKEITILKSRIVAPEVALATKPKKYRGAIKW